MNFYTRWVLAQVLHTLGFLKLILCEHLYVCVFVCVYAHVCLCVCVFVPKAMAWYIRMDPHDWLNMFYSLYVIAVVGIISRGGLSIDAHHENQPNKHKLALYKPSVHFNSSLK